MSFIIRFLLHLIFKQVVQYGTLKVTYSNQAVKYYHGKHKGPQASIRLLTPQTESAFILNPALSFGEKYMSGELIAEKDDLESVLRLFLFNIDKGTLFSDRLLRKVKRAFYVLNPFFLRNNLGRSRKNVAHHYDLNNHFYRLFLDEDMQYSCAYFKTGSETLEMAQLAKKRHLAQKLFLNSENLHVLDIGCGWGGLAITLAQEYGVRVTGITLSQAQLAIAQERVQKAGLSALVDFKLCDYRSLNQQFDRIISVGMLEHVGKAQYQEFFAKIKTLLKPQGVAVLHGIGRKNGPSLTNPWFLRYIFPGGYSPALSEVFQAVEQSKLWVADCEILRLHYAQTLSHWRQRFEKNLPEIQKMFDQTFIRMFRFYLTSAELSFRVQDHMNFQLQLTRDLETLPLTRDYLYPCKNPS